MRQLRWDRQSHVKESRQRKPTITNASIIFKGMSTSQENFVARPWGGYEVLPGLPGVAHQIKRLHVHPGARLSLQSHRCRSELWCIVQGEAEATLDGRILRLSYGGLLAIPVGAVHRLSNPGNKTLIVVEVQTGESFEEEDVVRYNDDYGRCGPPSSDYIPIQRNDKNDDSTPENAVAGGHG